MYIIDFKNWQSNLKEKFHFSTVMKHIYISHYQYKNLVLLWKLPSRAFQIAQVLHRIDIQVLNVQKLNITIFCIVYFFFQYISFIINENFKNLRCRNLSTLFDIRLKSKEMFCIAESIYEGEICFDHRVIPCGWQRTAG